MVELYRHYKGNSYKLLRYAIHTETKEQLVIYEDMKGNTYARPYNMFFEEVCVNGAKVPRFKLIDNVQSESTK